MSRPVFEPTTQRQIRKQGFSADQLFRRPAPPSGTATEVPWIRVWKSNNQTVTANSEDVVEFNTVINHYTSTFSTVNFNSQPCKITILEDGVYAFTFRIYLQSTNTNLGFTTMMNGIDFDEWLGYEKFSPLINTQLGASNSYVFRSGPSYGDTPPELFVTLFNPVGANASVVIDGVGGRPTATYMEMIKLGEAVVGNT